MIFRQRVLTNELHDFSKFVFLLKNLLDRFSKWHEFWIILGIVVTENTIVVGERDVPVD